MLTKILRALDFNQFHREVFEKTKIQIKEVKRCLRKGLFGLRSRVFL